jgi:Sulfotransferase family
MTFDRLVMVLGAPRSGTSWLGKIFDSHPDVLYRHEPDLALWERRLPFFIPESDTDAYVAIAADYVARLMRTPTLKASGQLPTFPKNYHSFGARPLRAAMINALRWVEAVSGSRRMRAFPVPDLFRPDQYAPLRIVMKSVSGSGRARVFMNALPGMRLILVLRHPCGQVASTLRGLTQGRFNTGVFVRDVLATPGAQRYRLTEQRLNAASYTEQLAWHWVTMNELILDAMSGHQNARFIVYEDLCADPLQTARDLFSFTGLDWNRQTENFIRRSTSFRGTERYFSVFRNEVAAASRWRTELSEQDQRVIMNVLAETSLGRFWADLPVPAETPRAEIDAAGL